MVHCPAHRSTVCIWIKIRPTTRHTFQELTRKKMTESKADSKRMKGSCICCGRELSARDLCWGPSKKLFCLVILIGAVLIGYEIGYRASIWDEMKYMLSVKSLIVLVVFARNLTFLFFLIIRVLWITLKIIFVQQYFWSSGRIYIDCIAMLALYLFESYISLTFPSRNYTIPINIEIMCNGNG